MINNQSYQMPSLIAISTISIGISAVVAKFSLPYFCKKPDIYIDYHDLDARKVIILFGWTGATYSDIKQKHLSFEQIPGLKKIYSIETPVMNTLFGRDIYGQTVFDLVNRCAGDDVHIVFYSGGGSLYYDQVNKHFKENVKTYTFDSSPVPFGTTHFANWIGHKWGLIWKLFSYVPLGFYMYFLDYDRIKKVNASILSNEHQVSTLFLNSKKDLLVPIHNLEKYKLKRSYSKFHEFPNSAHLLHDVEYPNEYKKLIADHFGL